MNNYVEIEARLDDLTTKILVPLRISKEVDLGAMLRLHEVVNDLARQLEDSENISRWLAGKLWLIFTQMLSEAEHTRTPEEILRAAWSYEDRLEKLFRRPLSSSGFTPGVPRY